MNCKKCGNLLGDGVAFCPNCGTKVEINTFENNSQMNTNNINNNGKQPKCFIIGIISIIISTLFGFLGIFSSIIGLIMVSQEKKQGINVKTGKMLNIIALILAIVVGVTANLFVYFNLFGNGEFDGDGYVLKYNSNWHAAELKSGTKVLAYKYSGSYLKPYDISSLATASCDIKSSDCQNVMSGIIELYLKTILTSDDEVTKNGDFQVLKDNIYCQSYTLEHVNEDYDSLFYLVINGDNKAVSTFLVKVVNKDDLSTVQDATDSVIKTIEFK